MAEKLLAAAEVAHLLSISSKGVMQLVRAGELPYIPIGAGTVRPRMRFDPKDVEDFIRRRKTRMTPPVSRSTLRVKSKHQGDFLLGFTERMAQRDALKKAERDRLTKPSPQNTAQPTRRKRDGNSG